MSADNQEIEALKKQLKEKEAESYAWERPYVSGFVRLKEQYDIIKEKNELLEKYREVLQSNRDNAEQFIKHGKYPLIGKIITNTDKALSSKTEHTKKEGK